MVVGHVLIFTTENTEESNRDGDYSSLRFVLRHRSLGCA